MNLTINLSIQSANQVLSALGRLAHDDVAPLIADIKRQALVQIEEAQRQAAAAEAPPQVEPDPSTETMGS